MIPELAQNAERGLGGVADDEPVREVPHAPGGGGAERGTPRPGVRDPHRSGDRRRGLGNLLEESGQVPRQVIE